MFSSQTIIYISIFIHISLCVAITLHALISRKETSSLLIWLIITYNIPFFGALLYFSFGVNKINVAKADRRSLSEQIRNAKYTSNDKKIKMDDFLTSYREQQHKPMATEFSIEFDEALSKIYRESAVVGYNKLTPLITGDNFYPELMKEIEKAEHHIHLQSFIIQRDQIGIELMEALKKKAEAGVVVRVMYDTLGSTKAHITHFFKKYKKNKNMHIEGWTLANPLKKQLQINLRNHRKSAIIDGETAFFGGINFHKENITRGDLQPIRDYHFKIEGPGVVELQYEFFRDWLFMTDVSIEKIFNSDYFFEQESCGDANVRLINTGPEIGSTPMTDLYFLAITRAKKSIIAVSPYFLPNPEIIQALKNAKNTGVDVKLITPKKNNHKYAGLAAKGNYSSLLECGIQIYEREEPFMHAKAMIIDDEIVIAGSSNLDVRSLTLNYESNAVIYSEPFAQKFKAVVLFDQAQSEPISYNKWIKRSNLEVVLEDICNLLAPVI
jgi:cardiolipin synthase A/B